MKVIIVDDIKDNVELLEYFINKYCPSVEIVGKAFNYDEAINLIQTSDFQVVFLDIKLDKNDGFDVLEKLHSSNVYVVFITAYEEFAIKAFKHDAVDYIVKPVGIQELKRVVEKLQNRIDSQTKEKTNINVKPIIDFIAIPSVNTIELIKHKDLLYLEADGGYTTFYLNNGKKVITANNLREYEKVLNKSNFFRVHNSYIVNLSHVKKIYKTEGIYLEFYNSKTIIPIARRRYSDLRVSLNC